jgi:hypothetical protein
MRAAVVAVLLAAVLAGCGGSGGGGGSGGADTAVRAAAEASETKVGLDRALEHYRQGDRGAAADVLKATRGEHFALVEGPLRGVDATLAARLHTAMRVTLPKLVDDGVTVSELAQRLADIEVDLDDAVVKLRAP